MQIFTFSAKKHTVAEFAKMTTDSIVADVERFEGEQEGYIVEAASDAEATELAAASAKAFLRLL